MRQNVTDTFSLKQGGGGGVFSKMSFALFVCTNKLLCNVYSVQCVRNRLMTMQEEAVV